MTFDLDLFPALLTATVDYGKSNSALVLGHRGTGKSALVTSVLHDLDLRARPEVMVVELNGILDVNDRLALRKITKHLKLENVVGDRVNISHRSVKFFANYI